jgi:hypothetical protein
MPDEKNDSFIDAWLDETVIPPEIRGYRPTTGPAEPETPPPGRASASMTETAAEMATIEPVAPETTTAPPRNQGR